MFFFSSFYFFQFEFASKRDSNVLVKAKLVKTLLNVNHFVQHNENLDLFC